MDPVHSIPRRTLVTLRIRFPLSPSLNHSSFSRLGNRYRRSLRNVYISGSSKRTTGHRERIGKYECGEAVPSIDTVKKISDAFSVTVDYLVNETARPTFDKPTIKRLHEIEELSPDVKGHLMALMDAFLRDAKAKKVYAQ